MAPSADDLEYRNQREVLEELVGSMAHGIEAVRDTQMLPFMGRTRFDPKPRSAMFWRSQQTIAVMRAHVEGLQQFFAASGLNEAIGTGNRWLPMSVRFDFEQALLALDGVSDPVSAVLEDAAQMRGLNSLLDLTRDLQNLVGVSLPELLGLSVGFSALDGD